MRIGFAAFVGMFGYRFGDGPERKICFGHQDLETGFWIAGHSHTKDKGIKAIERNANQGSSSRSKRPS